MAYDLVTWSPRIGATGDDKYNVPAATVLAAGSTAGYSATPTIAEINAGSGLNQIVAAVKRRIRTYNSLFGTSITEPSYVSSAANVISSGDFGSIQSAINDVRENEGFAAYTYSSTYSGLLVSNHIAQLRKALTIDGTLKVGEATGVFPSYIKSGYNRTDSPYGTATSEAFSASNILTAIGKNGVAGTVTRHRALVHFNIPEWLSACATATYNVKPLTYSSTETVTAEARFSATDDSVDNLSPAYGGTAYNGVSSIGAFDHTLTTVIPIIMTTSDITSRAGTRLSTTLFTSQERDQTGTGGNFANHYTVESVYLEVTF